MVCNCVFFFISLLASFTPSIFLKVSFLLLLFNIILYYIFFNKLQRYLLQCSKMLIESKFLRCAYKQFQIFHVFLLFEFCFIYLFIYVVCFIFLCMLYLFWRHPAKPIEGIIMFWTPKNLNFTTTNKQPQQHSTTHNFSSMKTSTQT